MRKLARFVLISVCLTSLVALATPTAAAEDCEMPRLGEMHHWTCEPICEQGWCAYGLVKINDGPHA